MYHKVRKGWSVIDQGKATGGLISRVIPGALDQLSEVHKNGQWDNLKFD
jgi:hypothetical protein